MKRVHRHLSRELELSAGEYPVVTVIGPRQSGKTTLVRDFFSAHRYANLENPEIRQLAAADPKTFLKTFPPPVIIDEVQNVPELLSWIQVAVDEVPDMKGGFILTGSHQLRLREAVTQSLAGRTALLTLLPFSLAELGDYTEKTEREELLFKGFMPRLHDQGIRPDRFFRDYFMTYVERDVRKLMAIENQQTFELFLRLLAARTGQELNYSDIAKHTGMSAPQIKKWISLLEASFIVFRLPPYFRNFGKRLTKSPKIYFVEPGLAVYLLGIDTPEQLARDPAFGSLFENMVVVEALKTRLNGGKDPLLCFFRDRSRFEVDLLYPLRADYLPVEIKSARTWRTGMTGGIRYFREISGTSLKGILAYDGDLETETEEARIVNFRRAFGF
jgi:predicted AAA+ superfamily ATPase